MTENASAALTAGLALITAALTLTGAIMVDIHLLYAAILFAFATLLVTLNLRKPPEQK